MEHQNLVEQGKNFSKKNYHPIDTGKSILRYFSFEFISIDRLPVFIPGRSNGLDFDESSSLKIMAVAFHKKHSRRGYGSVHLF